MAGRATLLGDHVAAQQLWREALPDCEKLSMNGYAAALRWRIAALSPADADALLEQARSYFDAERIHDASRYVALMAPAAKRL